MVQIASRSLKWAYALTVLAAVLPIGLASSGWVALTTGGTPLQAIPFVGPLIFWPLGCTGSIASRACRAPWTLGKLSGSRDSAG